MDCSGSSKLWQEVLWGETMTWRIRGVIPSDHTAGRSHCLLPGVWIWKNNYERATYGNPGEGWHELGLQEQKWRRRGMERFRVRPGGGVDWHVKWKRKSRLITVFDTWTTRWPEADFERWESWGIHVWGSHLSLLGCVNLELLITHPIADGAGQEPTWAEVWGRGQA